MPAAPTIGTPDGLPARVDLRIRQGSDVAWALRYFERTPDGTPLPNTYAGWSARYQVRGYSGGPVWLSGSSPTAISLTVADGKLQLTGLIGHAATEDPIWTSRSRGVWDVELVTAAGLVIPLAAGEVIVDADVTRA